MDPTLRARFNADFTPAKYEHLLHCVNTTEKWPADFRIAETPIFLTAEFTAELIRASDDIVAITRTPEFVRNSDSAIPRGLEVPNESAHPNFLVVDFAICAEGDRYSPRLIELQAFPSLYGFQLLLLDCMRKAYPAIPRDWTSAFGGMRDDDYLSLLREVIVGQHDVENVILLEIDPAKQNTRIDFASTERLLGIASVNIVDVRKRGRKLFYNLGAREVPIERIYNRVIFDELLRRSDLKLHFAFQDDLDVEWAGHPNWYFRVSKHSLPFLKTRHTSPTFFANDFPADEALTEYILKPLYSFAGLGVDLEPTCEKLQQLSNPADWILQKRVNYADFIRTPDGARSKAEIRMMYVWPEGKEPVLANNLLRLSQGAMMGVKFNKDKTWVGSSIALHER